MNNISPARGSNGLLEELKSAGFSVIDNRITSSIIWVIYNAGRVSVFEKIASRYNAQYSLERRGALATKNTPAWRVMATQSVTISDSNASVAATDNSFESGTDSGRGVDAIKDPNDISRIVMYYVNAGRWRDYLMFVLGINLGFKVVDLLQLQVKDLVKTDQSIRESIVINEQEPRSSGQRKKVWQLSLGGAVKEAIKLYLKHTPGAKPGDYLFRSESGNGKFSNRPLTRASVDQILRAAKNDLKLDMQMSTLTLRKTFAYHQLLLARDARAQAVVVRALNYSTVADALNYAGTTESELRLAQQRIDPAEDYYFNGSTIIEKETVSN